MATRVGEDEISGPSTRAATGTDPEAALAALDWRRLLVIAALALPPALIAVLQLGRLHPDEVFQMLEQAHRLAFGEGVVPWEWTRGLRNVVVPGVLSWLLELCALLGIDDPQARRAVLELPQYGLHALSLVSVYRLAQRRLDPAAARAGWGLAAAALVALYAPVLHYAGRTLTESFSASFLLIGLERADARGLRARSYALAGALLGMAVVVRYGSAVLALAALVQLATAGRMRDAGLVAAGGFAVACALGALDAATWGQPLHSLRAYVDYNLISGEAARAFGREPWWFYLPWLAYALPVWVWPALAAGLRRRARPGLQARAAPSALFLVCFAVYVVAISLTAHKEIRFLYPAVVLAVAAMAPVLAGLLARLPRAAAVAALAAALASGLVLLAFETRFSPRATEQFRLFVQGVRHGRGVVLTHSGAWGTPGAFYAAGRPWVLCARPNDPCSKRALDSARFDRVVGFHREGARALRKRGFAIAGEQGDFTLWAAPVSASRAPNTDRPRSSAR